MKLRRQLNRNYGTSRKRPPRPSPAANEKECRAVMTDAQRDALVKQSLTRFVRNKSAPEDLEDLRYNLIRARVLSGLTQLEAAEKFGYKNSTQLSEVESGKRKTPNDWKFLKQAAQTYSVSTDWLLGLSPHLELDTRVATQYALLRGTEQMMHGLVAQITSAMIRHTNESIPLAEEFAAVIAAADRVTEKLDVLRDRGEFDDLIGSNPVVAAVEHLNERIDPFRKKLAKIRGVDAYMTEMQNGTFPPIEHLTERYVQRDFLQTQRDFLESM
jgi:transcriptional regulator with XRE-family HTH domain